MLAQLLSTNSCRTVTRRATCSAPASSPQAQREGQATCHPRAPQAVATLRVQSGITGAGLLRAWNVWRNQNPKQSMREASWPETGHAHRPWLAVRESFALCHCHTLHPLGACLPSRFLCYEHIAAMVLKRGGLNLGTGLGEALSGAFTLGPSTFLSRGACRCDGSCQDVHCSSLQTSHKSCNKLRCAESFL